jgi:hypothetical protein
MHTLLLAMLSGLAQGWVYAECPDIPCMRLGAVHVTSLQCALRSRSRGWPFVCTTLSLAEVLHEGDVLKEGF